MGDNEEKEIERVKALLHDRRAMLLLVLRAEPALKLEEQAAVVYTLAIEPGIREHIPGVVMTSMAQQVQQVQMKLEEVAQTCQCAACKAQRPQA